MHGTILSSKDNNPIVRIMFILLCNCCAKKPLAETVGSSLSITMTHPGHTGAGTVVAETGHRRFAGGSEQRGGKEGSGLEKVDLDGKSAHQILSPIFQLFPFPILRLTPAKSLAWV